jgi:hypothetical protein
MAARRSQWHPALNSASVIDRRRRRRSAFSSAFVTPVKWIRRKPADARIGAPVRKCDERSAVRVARASRPSVFGFLGEPFLESFAVQVGKPSEAAIGGESGQVALDVTAMHRNRARGSEGIQMGIEVVVDLRRQVLPSPRFGGRE